MSKLKNYPQINAIYDRVSCRSFKNRTIPHTAVQEIIEAGTMAPASGNMQAWEFIVIDDMNMKSNVTKYTFGGFYSKEARSQDWIMSASIIIVACVNFKRTVARYGDLGYKMATIDTASAVQNMLYRRKKRISGTFV